MKKNIIFVTLYLQTGGVEKSLLSLLSSLDYTKYNVDLLLFDHSGVLFKMVPSQVNILPPLFKTYSKSLINAIPELIKTNNYRLLAGKILAGALSKFTKGVGTRVRWEVYKHTLKKQPKHYDVAISYLDIFCNYYVSEMVKADKKIVYNHMDYLYSQKTGWPCPTLERKSFSKSDYIVTVAESAKESLVQFFPEYSKKMRVIHNSVSSKNINAMSLSNINDSFFTNSNSIKIVTVARLVEEKGVLIALEACKALVEQGCDIQWFLIGNGILKDKLEIRKKELGLERHFYLLGEQENPYPYMRNCDIYVQPSKTEAHCVAVEEAIVLARPIVVTDIPSFKHQVKHQETGLIAQTSSEGIAAAIKELYVSKGLRDALSSNLAKSVDRNKKEVLKLCKLIDT